MDWAHTFKMSLYIAVQRLMFGFPWNFTSQRLFTFTHRADESYEKVGCHGVIALPIKIVNELYIGFQSSTSHYYYYYQWRIWNQNSFVCTSPNRSCWLRSDTIRNVRTRMLTLYVCDTHKKTWKKNAVPVCVHCTLNWSCVVGYYGNNV